MRVRVPGHTRNGHRVKGYSYNTGGKKKSSSSKKSSSTRRKKSR